MSFRLNLYNWIRLSDKKSTPFQMPTCNIPLYNMLYKRYVFFVLSLYIAYVDVLYDKNILKHIILT